MSTQVIDSPDWLENNQLQNPAPLVYENSVNHNGPVAYGPFIVAHWEALTINVVSSARLSVSVQWFADTAATQQVGFQNAQSVANVPYIDVLPVIAPVVQLLIDYAPGPGAVPTSTVILPMIGGDPWKRPLADLNVFVGFTQVVGASSTVSVTGQFTTTGRAILGVATDATAWQASLFPMSNLGNQQGQLAFIGTTPAQPVNTQDVSLPAKTVKLSLVNGDAVARTFNYSLVIER